MEKLTFCNLCKSNKIEIIDKECNICKCRSCGYVFDNPRPTIGELIKFYSKPEKYDSWIFLERKRDSLWKRRLKKILKTSRPGSLLDIGTGTGQFLHHAKDYFSEVYGTEVSESAIKIAKEKYSLDIFKGTIESIRLSKTFDNITLFHVLEHVTDPGAVIDRCKTLLNKEGIFIIAVPNDIFSWKNKLKLFLKRVGFKRFNKIGKTGLPKITLDGSIEEIHMSHFSADILADYLNKSGFKVINNSIDPYFVAGDFKLIILYAYYILNLLLMKITKKNRYDTIWIVAKNV